MTEIDKVSSGFCRAVKMDFFDVFKIVKVANFARLNFYIFLREMFQIYHLANLKHCHFDFEKYNSNFHSNKKADPHKIDRLFSYFRND
jgi:hypothetical protein